VDEALVKPAIRVLVVDDSPDITEVLGHVVGLAPGMECVGALGSADPLTAEVQRLQPHIVVLDARMPGKDPLVAMHELSQECPETRTIIYSGYDDPDFLELAIDAGAWGFVLKTQDSAVILGAIRSVASGRVSFPRDRKDSAGANKPAG
jgi:DNA-binding NarL/FixJ family response regulator